MNSSRIALSEDGFTGLELVILLVILIAAAGAFVILSKENTGSQTVPEGMIVGALQMTGGSLRPTGDIYGFSAIDTSRSRVPILFRIHDRNTLGAVDVTVALMIGDMGGIDMDTTKISWGNARGTEMIPRTDVSPLICPNWTIARKYNMLPYQSADADNILEPNEQFELLVCPLRGAGPYDQFTVTISPQGNALPLPVVLTAPARIQPVMHLN
jgi:hypothetical protein